MRVVQVVQAVRVVGKGDALAGEAGHWEALGEGLEDHCAGPSLLGLLLRAGLMTESAGCQAPLPRGPACTQETPWPRMQSTPYSYERVALAG